MKSSFCRLLVMADTVLSCLFISVIVGLATSLVTLACDLRLPHWFAYDAASLASLKSDILLNGDIFLNQYLGQFVVLGETLVLLCAIKVVLLAFGLLARRVITPRLGVTLEPWGGNVAAEPAEPRP